MSDEFGGVELEEPNRDEFGGVAVEEPQTKPFSLADIKLDPYQQAVMRSGGPPESQFTPHPEEVIPGLINAAKLPIDVLGLIGKTAVDAPARIKNWMTSAPPSSPAYVVPPSELPRPQIPLIQEGDLPPSMSRLAGAENVVRRAAQGMVPVFAPPEVGMTMPLLGGEGTLAKFALTYFGVSQLADLPDQVRNAIHVLQDPEATPQQKSEALGQPIVQTILGATMLHGGMRGKVEAPARFQGPEAQGSLLRLPEGGIPPRLEPPPGVELASPEEQTAALRASYRQTAGYEAPPPPRPVVPEYTPVAEDARSLGLNTINKVLAYYPELEGNREAARAIRNLAFPETVVGEPTTKLSVGANSALKAALDNLPENQSPPEPPAPAATPVSPPQPLKAPPAAAAEPLPTELGVDGFIKRLDDPTLSAGTEEAHQAGLKATTLADLDALAQKRLAIETAAYKAKAAGNFDTFVRLMSGIVQLPNEAIQAALNIGGAKEGSGTIPTKLGERPLDVATHPEAAEWLRNNWQALKLPEEAIPKELRQLGPVATKPSVSAAKSPEAATNVPATEPTVAVEPKSVEAAVPKVAAEVQRVAAAEGQRPAKEVKSELVSRLEAAIEKAPTEAEDKKGAVTIDIPGDGKFTVPNTKEALGVILKRAQRISTTQGTPGKAPSGSAPGAVAEQAKKVIAAYGSPEAAYQLVKRQQAELQSQEPPPGAQEREVWNQQIANAQALSEHIYYDTKAAVAESRAEALRSRIDTYREGQKSFEQEIAQVEKKKRKTTRDKVALQQLNEQLTENKQRVADWEKEIGQLEQQAKQEKAALESVAKPAPTPSKSSAPASVQPEASSKWDRPVTGESGFISLAPLHDLFDRVEPAVRRAFGAVRELGREAQNIKTVDDARRSVLNWSAKLQRSFSQAAAAQKAIRGQVPDKIRQDGITNWIQADGDPTVLRQRLAATQAWRDPQTGKPHPMAKRLVAGYEAALSLTPEEVAVANQVRGTYDALARKANRYELLKTFKDNYVTQIWNLARSPGGPGGRTLKDRFRFAKASTFPTFFDGEQAGFVPKTKSIAELLPVYMHEMNSVIAARQLVEEMAQGVASDGRPLLVPRGSGVSAEATGGPTLVMPKAIGSVKDYRVLENQPALHDWKWIAKGAAGEPVLLKADLAVHPEAYPRLKAALTRSAIREWYGTHTGALAEVPKVIVRGLDEANSVTKRTMLGFFAPFHQVQEGTHAIGHRVNPFFSIPKIDLTGNVAQVNATQHGLMLLPDRASESQFMEGFRVSGLVSRMPLLGPLADHYSSYLFHEYIPGLKFKTYQAILDRNQKVYATALANGRVTLTDIKALSAEQTNSAYGHLNYADLGRNPTIQHLATMGLLAPDFLEARGRFAGQAISGLTGAKVGREQLVALATLAIAQAATAYTAAKLTGGEWDPKHPFEFVYGKRRYTMRSIPEDVASGLTNPRQFVHNRLSPIIGKGALQYLSGVDYRGHRVTAGETTKELLQQPIPISVRGFLGIGNTSLTGMEQLAGAVGLKISRRSNMHDVQDLAHNWMKSSGEPKAAHKFELSQQQDFGESDYHPLRVALDANDMERAASAYRTLLAQGKKPKLILETIRPFTIKMGQTSAERHDKPVAGLSLDEQRRFVKSLSPDELKVYNSARADQRQQFERFLKMLHGLQAQPQ